MNDNIEAIQKSIKNGLASKLVKSFEKSDETAEKVDLFSIAKKLSEKRAKKK